ncbi:MAG: hypothetical protein QOF76_4370 [Solirubrobacteraceae bacterium]|jgi:hypothetical protein|nr:hypothetical protein [Solirubrobacteraceae bacterium]
MRLVVVVLLALGLTSASAAACGYTKRAGVRHPRGQGHRVGLFIGDSTGIFAVPLLAHRGIRADSKECRQFGEAFAIIRRRRARGTLPHLVVLGLGANGPVSTGQVSAAIRAIGRGRVLGLVTPRNLISSASAMRAVARRRPDRVLLIDWRAFSAGNGSWFAGDGLHVDGAGALAFTRLIVRRAAGVLSPPQLHHMRKPPRRACGRVRRRDGRHVRVYVLRGKPSCGAARTIARREPLTLHKDWHWYDWRPVRRGGWRDVYVSHHRRWRIVTR